MIAFNEDLIRIEMNKADVEATAKSFHEGYGYGRLVFKAGELGGYGNFQSWFADHVEIALLRKFGAEELDAFDRDSEQPPVNRPSYYIAQCYVVDHVWLQLPESVRGETRA